MSTDPTDATPGPVPAKTVLDLLKPFTADEDAKLRDSLKRCSPETYAAARAFRETGDLAHIPPLVHGIIVRYVERESRARLTGASDDLRLVEDLGLDSLTLMEIVVRADEVLPISINNEELCRLRTMGDVKRRVAELIATFEPNAGERQPT